MVGGRTVGAVWGVAARTNNFVKFSAFKFVLAVRHGDDDDDFIYY